jgi:hypothetical protein
MKKLLILALLISAYGLMASEAPATENTEEDVVLVEPTPEEFFVGPVIAPESNTSEE